MSGPTGLIFAMRASTGGTDRDGSGATPNVFNNEAFFNETPSGFSVAGGGRYGVQLVKVQPTLQFLAAIPLVTVVALVVWTPLAPLRVWETTLVFREMSFSIEKVTVEAKHASSLSTVSNSSRT